MTNSARWAVQDRDGHPIYLTQERWEHIIDPVNHPEMEEFEAELKETIRQGKRKQDLLNPQKYTYTKSFSNLVEDNTHIVAVAMFRFRERGNRQPEANNYIVTAYQKEIG